MRFNCKPGTRTKGSFLTNYLDLCKNKYDKKYILGHLHKHITYIELPLSRDSAEEAGRRRRLEAIF